MYDLAKIWFFKVIYVTDEMNGNDNFFYFIDEFYVTEELNATDEKFD